MFGQCAFAPPESRTSLVTTWQHVSQTLLDFGSQKHMKNILSFIVDFFAAYLDTNTTGCIVSVERGRQREGATLLVVHSIEHVVIMGRVEGGTAVTYPGRLGSCATTNSIKRKRNYFGFMYAHVQTRPTVTPRRSSKLTLRPRRREGLARDVETPATPGWMAASQPQQYVRSLAASSSYLSLDPQLAVLFWS